MISVKRLMKELSIEKDTARLIRLLMENDTFSYSYENCIAYGMSEKVRKYCQQGYHFTNDHDMIMCAIDDILENFGIEIIESENDYVSHYYQNCVAEYSNTGDSYCNTILYDTQKEEFYITSWGDFVERNLI